ncbi:hypothetical protein AA0614_2477 [Komagataeibacter saccharivorans NRIC 0614]|nr:hypothetical protein AA0614_2477 [Komagataeibacter saccharivorans NRIC 0614]
MYENWQATHGGQIGQIMRPCAMHFARAIQQGMRIDLRICDGHAVASCNPYG